MDDIKFMKMALKLARKAVGFTEPNPLVGAVVVKNHRVVATGYHRKYGADHAERDALGNAPVGSTILYVTLEPCIHFGKTPPCVPLVIEKKIKRVVVAMKDPNPLVNGKGIQRLKESGIAVEVGLLADMACKLNRHYIKYISQKMPYVILKAGISLDGKLTDKYRKSQWVTSEELRTFSHTLRGEFSAIMTGVKTVIDDNPQLNIREKAWGSKRLYRIILDSHNTLDTRLRVFKDQEQFPLILFSSKETKNRTPRVKNHFFVTPDTENRLNLREILDVLYQKEIASVMVEGGGSLFNSFLKENLYDEIILFQAGTLIGGNESVQLFAEGTSVSIPIELKERDIIQFKTGSIIRGFRSLESWGPGVLE
jgi:diaminohydroxyphosphoribosylaminopyrimidine deaminase/5-amino-6-(5-phosphoribosylamino)uracil reductase